MTVKELYDTLLGAALRVYEPREAGSVADLIIETVYGIAKVDRLLSPTMMVETRDIENLVNDIVSGRPAQYIMGVAHFLNWEYRVTESVLIPRPETEELVLWASEFLREGDAVLDIATGSGVIAVSIAAGNPGLRVYATDVSEDALEIAKYNAVKHGTNVYFLKHDILRDPLPEEWLCGFDMIISNPPYIPVSERNALHRNVREFEPPIALFVEDERPLLFYKRITEASRSLLKPGGRLFFEIHENYGDGVAYCFRDNGFTDIKIHKDIHGRDRMAAGVLIQRNG